MTEQVTPFKLVMPRYANFHQFFLSFTTLIRSSNYVTKRQSLKLLGEILLDRANFNVMTKYIANEANLKMMMNLLRDKSKNIQFEAFHVFKVGPFSLFLVEREYSVLKVPPTFQVFVANPKKPPQIEIILRRNKEKLLNFLKTFHNDKEGAHAHFSILALDISSSSIDIFLSLLSFCLFLKKQASAHELHP